jgi:regulator of cell morphogenesis and NO signaling
MSIQVTAQTVVRDLAGRYPATLKVFEDHGIDYCCGGDKCLAEAAQESGAELGAVVAALQAALSAAPSKAAQPEKDWYGASLSDLINHIVDTHHAYMKKALPQVRDLLKKVLRAHGPRHGELLHQVEALFAALDEEITAHLSKEENVLFPYIASADAHARGKGAKPVACFPTVRAPIQQMQHEHENAGQALERIREITGNYTLPADACPTFAALYEALEQMEADLHRHIHLENNILFPRALETEKAD